ncbi:MAG TPA: hypothetical protein QF589_06435, partial [Anaerolineales bacterium]|jgi:hypothetical protein|nr:hypothetical protein [Anaerolineales bacterium]
VGLTIAAVSVVAFSALTYMGTPFYAVSSSADQEVVAALVPQTHPGPLRSTPFEQLPAGQYAAAQWKSAPTAGLREILELYEHELHKYGDELPDSEGMMIVEDWQVGLKKVTLRVLWNSGEDTFEQNVFLHQASGYGE